MDDKPSPNSPDIQIVAPSTAPTIHAEQCISVLSRKAGLLLTFGSVIAVPTADGTGTEPAMSISGFLRLDLHAAKNVRDKLIKAIATVERGDFG